MSDPLEDFLSRWDGVDPLDSPASPARDLVLAAQFEDEVQNGGLAQFLWNRFPRWEAILDGADRAYLAMGAERQLAALPEIRAVLRENAPLCAKRIELARNETEPGQAFSVWYESAEERMGLPSEELFYPDEPTLAAARRAYLEANPAALGDGPQGRARGKRPMKRPPTSRRARIACWALFLVCLFLPLPLSIAFGAPFRLLHGLETMNTGNVMEARGGPWPFFVMRDLTFRPRPRPRGPFRVRGPAAPGVEGARLRARPRSARLRPPAVLRPRIRPCLPGRTGKQRADRLDSHPAPARV